MGHSGGLRAHVSTCVCARARGAVWCALALAHESPGSPPGEVRASGQDKDGGVYLSLLNSTMNMFMNFACVGCARSGYVSIFVSLVDYTLKPTL